jgi:hypothetical protein
LCNIKVSYSVKLNATENCEMACLFLKELLFSKGCCVMALNEKENYNSALDETG